mgnify:CR=1 FL=1
MTHPLASGYVRREPENTVLHQVVREHLETFLAQARENGRGLPLPSKISCATTSLFAPLPLQLLRHLAALVPPPRWLQTRRLQRRGIPQPLEVPGASCASADYYGYSSNRAPLCP